MAKAFGPRIEKNKKAEFLLTLEKNAGLITTSLEKAGVSRYYYDKWLSEDEDFVDEINKIIQKTLDLVESKLFKLINDGDRTAIIFYLKCKGKDRGYVEIQRIEQQTSYIEPLEIKIIAPEQQASVKNLPTPPKKLKE